MSPESSRLYDRSTARSTERAGFERRICSDGDDRDYLGGDQRGGFDRGAAAGGKVVRC